MVQVNDDLLLALSDDQTTLRDTIKLHMRNHHLVI